MRTTRAITDIHGGTRAHESRSGRVHLRRAALPAATSHRLRVVAISLALVVLVALLLTASPAVTTTLGIVFVMGLFVSSLVALVERATRGERDTTPSGTPE